MGIVALLVFVFVQQQQQTYEFYFSSVRELESAAATAPVLTVDTIAALAADAVTPAAATPPIAPHSGFP